MKTASLLLALLAVLTAAGAAGYSWWNLNQLLDGERRASSLNLVQERRIGEMESDLTSRIAVLNEQRTHLSEQLAAANARTSRTEAALEATRAHLRRLEIQSEKIAEDLKKTDHSWLLGNIADTLRLVERNIYMRQSTTLIDALLNQVLQWTASLPPARSALLTETLRLDRARLHQMNIKSLPDIAAELDHIGTLIAALPNSCCADFAKPDIPTSGNAWEQFWSLLMQAVKIRRIDTHVALPNQREKQWLRLHLSNYLIQARGALWNYDDTGWSKSWQELIVAAERALPHDPKGLEQLRQAAGKMQALSVQPVSFRFEDSWNALKKAP